MNMNNTRYSFIPIKIDQQLVGALAVLSGGFLKPSPGDFMDKEILRFENSPELKSLLKGSTLKPQGAYTFVEEHLDNPWLRVLVWGVENVSLYSRHGFNNGLEYEEFVRNDNNLIIIRGGFETPNPKSYMDAIVMELVQNRGYNQFIEATLTNPYYRILLFNINELEEKVF